MVEREERQKGGGMDGWMAGERKDFGEGWMSRVTLWYLFNLKVLLTNTGSLQ